VKIKKQTIHDVKLIMIMLTIFALAVSGFLNWYLIQQLEEKEQAVAIYKHNVAEMTKGFESGRVILELKEK
jgi:hypothetical protein